RRPRPRAGCRQPRASCASTDLRGLNRKRFSTQPTAPASPTRSPGKLGRIVHVARRQISMIGAAERSTLPPLRRGGKMPRPNIWLTGLVCLAGLTWANGASAQQPPTKVVPPGGDKMDKGQAAAWVPLPEVTERYREGVKIAIEKPTLF